MCKQLIHSVTYKSHENPQYMCETFFNIVFVLNATNNYDYAGFYLLYLFFATTTVHLQCMGGGGSKLIMKNGN